MSFSSYDVNADLQSAIWVPTRKFSLPDQQRCRFILGLRFERQGNEHTNAVRLHFQFLSQDAYFSASSIQSELVRQIVLLT